MSQAATKMASMVDLVTSTCPELGGLTDADLQDFAVLVREEQRRRCLAAGDLDAVVAEAFATGFDARGMAIDPWVTPHGLVVCPGSKIQRSRHAHRCRFVAVGELWVWESADRLVDEIRPVLDGRDSLQTVTVIPGWEGLVLDVVTSRATGGVHTRIPRWPSSSTVASSAPGRPAAPSPGTPVVELVEATDALPVDFPHLPAEEMAKLADRRRELEAERRLRQQSPDSERAVRAV